MNAVEKQRACDHATDLLPSEGGWVRRFVRGLLAPGIPSHLSARFRNFDHSRLDALKSRFETWYATHHPETVGTPTGELDTRSHLWTRFERNRRFVIPWLDAARPLRGATVLEIGCGTGSSTVALAEQGARVTALDIDELAMEVAQERCGAYGVEARFIRGNASELSSLFRGEHFDFIIFFATLEHMTYKERLDAMKGAWEMLDVGGLWGVIETPNRIWFYDSHTSFLPFFMWLPDDVAFDYARFSPRRGLRERFQGKTDEARLEFLRWGRAASYHEFEIAMAPLASLQVVSSLELYHRSRSLLRHIAWRASSGYAYERFLRRLGPREAHAGFFQPYLDLLIRKTESESPDSRRR